MPGDTVGAGPIPGYPGIDGTGAMVMPPPMPGDTVGAGPIPGITGDCVSIGLTYATGAGAGKTYPDAVGADVMPSLGNGGGGGRGREPFEPLGGTFLGGTGGCGGWGGLGG